MIEPITADEARKKRAGDHHDEAMRLADEADAWRKEGHHNSAILSLLSAATSEYKAAMQIEMMEPPHELTLSVFYRSASNLALQASVALVELGLRGHPDEKLRSELQAELEKLR